MVTGCVVWLQLLAMLQDAVVINWHPAVIFAPVWLTLTVILVVSLVVGLQSQADTCRTMRARAQQIQRLELERDEVLAEYGLAKPRAATASASKFAVASVVHGASVRRLPPASRAAYLEQLIYEEVRRKLLHCKVLAENRE